MANQVILDYLKKYSKKYRAADLKRKIVSSGYNEEEVDEALDELGLKKPEGEKEEKKIIVEKPVGKEEEKASESKRTGLASEEEKFVGLLEKTEPLPVSLTQRMTTTFYSSWLKVGGVSGVILVILLVFFLVFVSGAFGVDIYILSPFVFISSLIISLVSVLFLYSFIILEKKYGKRLVRISSWMLICLVVLLIIFLILLMVFPEDIGGYLFGNLAVDSSINLLNINLQELVNSFFNLIILFGAMMFIFIILNIIFGVGLIKLKIPPSKLAGILHVIGALLLVVGVGAIVLMVAYVVDVVLLIKESKK